MKRLESKKLGQELRRNRVRSKVHGTSDRPRLSVFISNRHITAQIINDDTHETLVASTTSTMKLDNKTMTEKATIIGDDVAKKALKSKIKSVSFDRGYRLYHGRTKALAEAARNAGLEF